MKQFYLKTQPYNEHLIDCFNLEDEIRACLFEEFMFNSAPYFNLKEYYNE